LRLIFRAIGPERAVRELHREGAVPRGAEPSFGGRAGTAQGEVGQRDDAHQGDVRGRAGRRQEAARGSREGEGQTRTASRRPRGGDRRTAAQVRTHADGWRCGATVGCWTCDQEVVGSIPGSGRSCVTTVGKSLTPACLDADSLRYYMESLSRVPLPLLVTER